MLIIFFWQLVLFMKKLRRYTYWKVRNCNLPCLKKAVQCIKIFALNHQSSFGQQMHIHTYISVIKICVGIHPNIYIYIPYVYMVIICTFMPSYKYVKFLLMYTFTYIYMRSPLVYPLAFNC